MKLSWLLTGALVGSAVATANVELDHESVNMENLEKRAFDAVTGVPGTAYPRLEIRNLRRNADQWNIFILGLFRFQNLPQNQKFSYYQIAGIHGRPFYQWNDVPGVRSTGGYCPHVSNMFLPWHRPYLALFEQQLVAAARQAASEFPAATRQRWVNAAATLRMPYYDWASAPPVGECSVPQFLRDQTISVTTPNGQQSIRNPLYSYQFHPAGGELGANPYASWQYTWRRPVLPAATARSNNNEFCDLMNRNRVSLRDRVYNLFTRTTLYRLFSTEATGGATGNPENHDSIEAVHDVVHIVAGGPTGGHMYYLDYSAFDPLFWLHHCNIDRFGAMFQVINPNSYVEPGAQTQNSFQWNRGEVKNWYTPLKPFTRDTAGNFWVPETVRSTYTFNYFYPETPRTATPASVRANVNTLYGPGSPSRKRDFRLASRGYEGHGLETGDRNYVTHVTCDKFAVGGSYSVNFYLGNPNDCKNGTAGYNSTAPYGGYNSTGPQYIGCTGVLAPYEKMDAVNIVSSQLPITTALQAKYLSGEISSLDEDTVNEYLAKNLYWEVVKAGGETVPAEALGAMKVACSSQEVVSPGGGDEFPTYSPPKYHPDVTKGKPYGSDSSDDTCQPVVEYKYVDESGEFLYSTMGSKL